MGVYVAAVTNNLHIPNSPHFFLFDNLYSGPNNKKAQLSTQSRFWCTKIIVSSVGEQSSDDSPVDGDAGDGESGDEGDANRNHPGELADPLDLRSQPPLVHDLCQGDRADHGAQQQVADGQVHDQDVVHLKVVE